MFGSETLEVAIGLAVLFSFLSLFASSLRESIEAWVKQRAKFVHDAMDELFSTAEKADTESIREFYDSIIISPSYKGEYDGRSRNLPSYIPSGDFAAALIEVAKKQADEVKAGVSATATEWIDQVKNTRVAALLRLAYQNSGNDPDKARQFLEQWYDGQMDRVSGWYRRRTQLFLLIIGFLTAALLNVDSITIAQHLYRNNALRDVIVAKVQASPKASGTVPAAGAPADALSELKGYGFPIGWTWNGSTPVPAPQCELHGQLGNDCALGPGAMVLMVIGWIITMFAVSLGAPFWFDLLNKFVVVRSTVKPFEKSPPAASEDRQAPTEAEPKE